MTETKDTNPKDALAGAKIPLDIVPDTALLLQALAHLDGALKYGKWNWRVAGVRASVYVGACRRHLAAWMNGEEVAPDGVHHLGHAMACLNIIVDAGAAGKLTDDRPPTIDYQQFADDITRWVPIVRERHKGKNPKHWAKGD